MLLPFTTPDNPPARPAAGIAMCVCGLFLFSLQDLIIKYFSGDYSVLQLVFTRGVVATVPILAVAVATAGWRSLRTRQPKMLLARGGFGFFCYLSYYMAMAALPLVDVVTILFTTPILVTIISALLLKETVGARRWGGLAVGFLAIVIVVGPRGDLRHLATLLAFASAFAYSGSILVTRFIGAKERPLTITLYSMFAFIFGSCVAAALVAAFGGAFSTENPALQFLLREWRAPQSALDFWLMLALGANAALAFYCLIRAYWIAPGSIVAPFEYTYIIWAALFGWFVWNEAPHATSLFGVGLLIASSFYLFRAELRESRAAERDGV